MLLIFFVLSVVLLCVLMFWVPVPYDFRIKTMFVRLYLQLFVGGLMSYVCLFAVMKAGGLAL